jgi:hypothetical protein
MFFMFVVPLYLLGGDDGTVGQEAHGALYYTRLRWATRPRALGNWAV